MNARKRKPIPDNVLGLVEAQAPGAGEETQRITVTFSRHELNRLRAIAAERGQQLGKTVPVGSVIRQRATEGL